MGLSEDPAGPDPRLRFSEENSKVCKVILHGSVVIAGRRPTGENEAVAKLDLVAFTEEGQEFLKRQALRRAGEEPSVGPEFLRHLVCERSGRDALRVFGDERHDFVSVDLFGGHDAKIFEPAVMHKSE